MKIIKIIRLLSWLYITDILLEIYKFWAILIVYKNVFYQSTFINNNEL